MSGHYVFFAFLVVMQISAIKGQICTYSDQSDQVLYSKDYGVSGTPGPVNLPLSPILQPGAVISVVTKTQTTQRGTTNLHTDANPPEFLLHVDARLGWSGRNELLLSTFLNGAWRQDYKQLVNPIAKDAKVTTTIVYEEQGYRIFINGRFIAFYEHRDFRRPTVLNLEHDIIYKVVYLTTTAI